MNKTKTETRAVDEESRPFDDVMRQLLRAKPKPQAVAKKAKAKAKPKANGGST